MLSFVFFREINPFYLTVFYIFATLDKINKYWSNLLIFILLFYIDVLVS